MLALLARHVPLTPHPCWTIRSQPRHNKSGGTVFILGTLEERLACDCHPSAKQAYKSCTVLEGFCAHQYGPLPLSLVLQCSITSQIEWICKRLLHMDMHVPQLTPHQLVLTSLR